MAYQALYRKWRPRTFDSVVGQTAITSTLKNAIRRGTISHAFLFAGPRGTGKTSCAKIFAKALNCTNLQDGEPCNQCENCKAADAGTMPDIMEIDAASNNGVDEIREIRDKVKYAPTQGKYKVYIIDEVHMLSIGAFNALLKTLEEPPEHVVFILATTELQKVPATIISRTQRYNFKRISNHDLVERMKYILSQEKIAYDEKALGVIAQVADGGMRDALSILDQLLSYEKEKINYEDALKITGFAARENVEQILLSLLKEDANTALKESQKALAAGASSQNILDELIDLATNSLLVNKANDQTTQSNFLTKDFAKKVSQFPSQRYFQLITLANDALNDLRYTNQQEIPLEVFLVKASQKVPTVNAKNSEIQSSQPVNGNLATEVNALKKQILSLTEEVSSLSKGNSVHLNPDQVFHISDEDNNKQKNKPKETTAEKAVQVVKHRPKRLVKQPDKENRKQVYHVLENATRADLNNIKKVWPDLKSILEVSEKALLDVLEPVAASPTQVVMKCKYALWFEKASSDSDLLEKLTTNIEKFTKHSYSIVLVPDSDWLKVRQEFVESHKDELIAKKKKKVATVKEKDKQQKEADSEVISRAKDLFGDKVNIKD